MKLEKNPIYIQDSLESKSQWSWKRIWDSVRLTNAIIISSSQSEIHILITINHKLAIEKILRIIHRQKNGFYFQKQKRII